MTSYRLMNDGFASLAEPSESEVRDIQQTDRLPWRIAAPLLFCMSLGAWGLIFLLLP